MHLSCNLTGGVFVNQSAAFSDFHASGANPAANAALTDGAYVASRFRIVQSRRTSDRPHPVAALLELRGCHVNSELILESLQSRRRAVRDTARINFAVVMISDSCDAKRRLLP